MEFNVENYLSNMSYINKDVYSLWQEIQETVPKLTNKWLPSEANESDPLIVLLKELAIVADKVNYNTDKNILELFPDLVTQLRTAYNVFESMGYNPKWYKSALTTISINYNGGVGDSKFNEEGIQGKEFKIPKFTQVSDEDSNIVYTLISDTNYTTGTASIASALALEGTINDFTINGSNLITLDNLDERNRLYFTQPNVAQNGLFVSNQSDFSDISISDSVDSEASLSTWRLVDNLAPYTAGNKIYKFGIDPVTGSNYLEFPQDIGEIINQGIYIKYILSSGEAGNIKMNTISKFFNSLNIDINFDNSSSKTVTDANFKITNSTTSQNGKDPESIEEMKHNYSKVVGTFNTLVTLRDYENYIYNYTEPYTGNPVVSNIRVSDFNNNLTKSLEYQLLTKNGDQATAVLKNPSLTPYDLGYHALTPVPNIVDKKSFDRTFTLADGNAFLKVISSTEDAKIINHDISATNQSLIIVPYDISGQIYLHKTVPETEAKEIKNNIDLALYKSLNAREINFGSAINYKDVLDIITNADSRVQYVALNPINYNLIDHPIEVLEDGGKNTSIKDFKVTIGEGETYNLNQLSVFAGTQPWAQYSPYIYNYNQTGNINTISYNGNVGVYSIQPYIDVGNSPINEYKVKENETLSILAPLYNTETTYSNYLYYKASLGSSGNIPKDTLYQLKETESILIYDERPTDSSTPIYTLGNGTIIQANHNIVNSDTYVNMGSKHTISVMKLASNNLITSTPNESIKIGTNSLGLNTMLVEGNSGAKFTLGIGEYLIYSDINELELGILGEGTTIIKTEGWSEDGYGNNFMISSSAIGEANEGLVPSTLHKVGNSYCLSYILNNIYSFGSGYTLTAKKDNNEVPIIPENSGDNIKKGLVYNIGSGLTISYSLGDSSGTIPVSNIGNSDYLGLLNLQLIVGPGKEQTLKDNQKVKITKTDNNTTIIEENNSIQSNTYIIYPGGTGLVLSEDESKKLGITYVEINANASFKASTNSIFTYIGGNSITVQTPGGNNNIFLIATVVESAINYYLIKGNTSLTLEGTDLKISRPYLLSDNNLTIKKEDGTNYNASELIGTSNKVNLSSTEYKNLTLNGLYNLLYEPDEEEIINDPTDPSSFFKSNHVLNRYSIPKLNSLSELKISPLSIKGGGG